MSRFVKGQILYYYPRGNGGSARKGALCVYQGPDGSWCSVVWLRNQMSSQQGDGGYGYDDFRIATQAEIDAHELELTKAVEAFVAAKAANPRFAVGDYVYSVKNRHHLQQPYKVLEIYNGVAFCFRGVDPREPEHTTHKVEELEQRPHAFESKPPRY